jgi:hypothetical protein
MHVFTIHPNFHSLSTHPHPSSPHQPVMDGPDATRAIRALGYTGPILGVTGNTLDMDVRRFTESGCDHVMGKPFRLEEFVVHMDGYVSRRLSKSLWGVEIGGLGGASAGGGAGGGAGVGVGAGQE